MPPEEKARLVIDKKLRDAGWILQDMGEFDPSASLGVAVREFYVNGGGEADYALFVDRKPVGLIEAKASQKGVLLLNEASEQNMGYARAGLKGNYDKNDLRFLFEATDILVQFTDLCDPKPRMRKIFSFYTPEYLAELINDYKQNGKTLRGRMQDFPELESQRFRACQINAIRKLEESFSLNKPRALIQMATGAGKTYTAITNTYRLLKHAKARRVLFLVDTNNLGAQAEMEYRNYQPYDSPSKFSELYKVQRIQTSNIPSDTVVCISTIQRLYSMLKGEIANFLEGTDDELGNAATSSAREVEYNKDYPPEFFDVIFIDECHRSIYNRWKQVLDYFDAFLVGLTATPNVDTYAFFDKNVVSEYTHEQAVRDNVNVAAFDTFVIETEKTENGGTIARIDQRVEIRDKRTRQQKWEEADEDITYEGDDLDRAVVNKNTIQLILETFRDNWKNWIYFQDRDELPKTLIFAKDESHAADIVEIARQVFNEGNDFCKKITYKSEEDEHALLYNYRNNPFLRIAVTVSKIATGTDVKPIEILFFMRNIRDENYYEQMLGRARRTLEKESLKLTSPSANSDKLGYVIVDAAGVTKSKKITRGRGGRDKNPTIPFRQLIANAVNGDHSDETLSSLGERIERLDKVLTPEERKKFENSFGITISELAERLKDAYDSEKIDEEVQRRAYKPDPEENTGGISDPVVVDIPEDVKEKLRKEILKERREQAVEPLLKPNVRDFLTTIRNTGAQTIDPALDSLRVASFSSSIDETLETTRKNFREFIDAHKDEIDALQIIYNQDFRNRHITEEMIHELYAEMAKVSRALTQPRIFSAYAGKAKTPLRELVDIIQVIRYEWGQIENLVPFADGVRNRYKTWIFTKNKNKGGSRGVSDSPFSDEQLKWLSMIRDHIAMNASIQPEALNFGEFAKNGGAAKYCGLFGDHWKDILEELNVALVA